MVHRNQFLLQAQTHKIERLSFVKMLVIMIRKIIVQQFQPYLISRLQISIIITMPQYQNFNSLQHMYRTLIGYYVYRNLNEVLGSTLNSDFMFLL